MRDHAEDVQFARLRSRVAAFLLDYLVICGYIAALAVVSSVLLRGPLQPYAPMIFATPIRRDLVAFTTLILPVLLYFTIGESSAQAGTWGKRRRGLRVTDRQGRRISAGCALVRSIGKLLPWQIAHTSLFHIPGWPFAAENPSPPVIAGFVVVYVLIGANIASMFVGPRRQTLYDRIAATIVIGAER